MGRFKKGVRLTLKEVKRRLSEIRTDIEIIDEVLLLCPNLRR